MAKTNKTRHADASAGDCENLRRLAGELAELAQQPVQDERRANWTALNDLRPNRPMVFVTEIPWDEFALEIDELRPRCEDASLRGVEAELRQRLWVEKYLDTDRVVEPTYSVWKKIHGTGFGLCVHERTIEAESGSHIKAHEFEPVITDVDDVEKIRMPEVRYDEETTLARVNMLDELFGDLLPVRACGPRTQTYNSWDIVIQWIGVTRGLMDLVMRPDYIHAIMRRLTDAVLCRTSQLAEKGLLDAPHPRERVGSGGAGYTEQLPQSDCDGEHFRVADQWGSATSQIFGEVSPEMHDEFALQYERELLDQCGLTYYGCCEPLHNKMHLMAKIPNLRKISISPWCDPAVAYENAQTRYVFSHKPNPAVFASDRMHLDEAEAEIRTRLEQSGDMPCEIVMKDISTVRKDPQRLIDWSKMAMRAARNHAPDQSE